MFPIFFPQSQLQKKVQSIVGIPDPCGRPGAAPHAGDDDAVHHPGTGWGVDGEHTKNG